MSSDIKAVTYESAIAVTASDTAADPSGPFAGLYNGSAANTIVVTTMRGTKVTFTGVPIGTILPVAIQRVWITGTSNTALVLGLLALPYKGTGV